MTLESENSSWSVSEIDYDGVALQVRINDAAHELIGHPDLGIKLGFAVPMQAATNPKSSDPDREQALAELEDRIIATVSSGAEGIHVMTLANADMKELVFYIKEGADIDAMYGSLRESEQTYEVQCHADRDRQWDAFTAFVKT